MGRRSTAQAAIEVGRTVQVLMSTGASNGTFQHALTLLRACAGLGQDVTLVDIQPAGPARRQTRSKFHGITYQLASLAELSHASLNIIVGLWDKQTAEAARYLSSSGTRLILAPTVYWDHDMRPYLTNGAEALWYVSWDQASWDRDYWNVAKRVDIIRCSVDTDRFCPRGRVPTGRPWLLGRHSRDVAEKFPPDMGEYIRRIGENHDVRFRMLGAAQTMCDLKDDRAVLYREDEMLPDAFLAECDVWVYAHAPDWRETACIAMLEAMASGLPVVVENSGGMREYVQHGRTGFLCNDLEEFVRYTSLLLDMPDLCGLMGSQARASVEKFHSIEVLMDRLRPIVCDGTHS